MNVDHWRKAVSGNHLEKGIATHGSVLETPNPIGAFVKITLGVAPKGRRNCPQTAKMQRGGETRGSDGPVSGKKIGKTNDRAGLQPLGHGPAPQNKQNAQGCAPLMLG